MLYAERARLPAQAASTLRVTRQSTLRIQGITMIGRIAWLTLVVGTSVSVTAAAATPQTTTHRQSATSALAISPIFSQLVAFKMPLSFQVVNEETGAHSYIREAVPKGETTEQWTQMITVTGYKDAAADPGPPPAALINTIADGFTKACPDTVSVGDLGKPPIDGYPAQLAFVACGSATDGGSAHREAALILAIKGSHDYYTIQWAERGPAQATRVAFDQTHWMEKLKQLMPIFLCAKVSGEQAPYPSCVSRLPGDDDHASTHPKGAAAKP
jgi:hypothetical protein